MDAAGRFCHEKGQLITAFMILMYATENKLSEIRFLIFFGVTYVGEWLHELLMSLKFNFYEIKTRK